MKRMMIAIAMFFALAYVPPVGAASASAGGSSGSGGVRGKISSVTTTNFSMTSGGRGKGRHRHRIKSTLVHYNPDSVTITVDGVAVRFLDVAAMGKYATVVGVVKNNVLEASSITITTAAPAHGHKSKSASS